MVKCMYMLCYSQGAGIKTAKINFLLAFQCQFQKLLMVAAVSRGSSQSPENYSWLAAQKKLISMLEFVLSYPSSASEED